MRYALSLAALLGTCGVLPGVEHKPTLPPANLAIQMQIAKLAAVIKLHGEESRNDSQVCQELQKLKSITEDGSQIVEQLAVFSAVEEVNEEILEPLLAGYILEQLEIKPRFIVHTLAPYLSADNENLHEFVRNWFRRHDNGGPNESPLKPVNYEDYRDYVSAKVAKNEPIPEAFIEYLFERSPGRALLVFIHAEQTIESIERMKAMRKNFDQQDNSGQGKLPQTKPGSGRKDKLLAEHLISSAIWLKRKDFPDESSAAIPVAIAELTKLSNQEEWWARRYVVQIMKQHRELRKPEILRRLAGDPNPLVAKTAKSINP